MSPPVWRHGSTQLPVMSTVLPWVQYTMEQRSSRSLASRVDNHALLTQEFRHPIPRQGGSTMAMDPNHLLVRDEGVNHGLLGSLHCGLEERIKEAPWNEPQLVIATFSGIEGSESR